MYALEERAAPNWQPKIRPPAQLCPRKFCFHFVPDGARFAPGLHADLEEAIAVAAEVRGDHCACAFGRCSRLSEDRGDVDWYEPQDVELESAGLPWFFFIPTSEKVVEALKAQYLREARALGGDAQ